MHLVLKTLLNHVERLKGFVYESSRLVDEPCTRTHIEIQLRARERSRGACCGHCQKPAPGYDRLSERHFQFVPLWGIPTFFRYAPWRVRCREHGIVVEHLPWALGKRPLTASFAWFLASWAKLLSWQDVSRTFKTSWESVFRSVEMAVDWGRARMDLTGSVHRERGTRHRLWGGDRSPLGVTDGGCSRSAGRCSPSRRSGFSSDSGRNPRGSPIPHRSE
ncbi:MAG: hypothetical protein WBE91_02360 [Steroidobacteraceae bacterium]